MSKSVYSLVLNDEVVRAVDRAAARQGLSRSEMVTRLLADSLSLTTPEMRVRRILDSAQELLLSSDAPFRLSGETSDNVLALRSALAFKYNPTVRYAVELSRGGEDLGVLRVSMRTQNETLLAMFADFVRTYARIESEYLAGVRYRVGTGRFERVLSLRSVPDAKQDEGTVGSLISAYVDLLDRCMKIYFSSPEEAEGKIDRMIDAFATAHDYTV